MEPFLARVAQQLQAAGLVDLARLVAVWSRLSPAAQEALVRLAVCQIEADAAGEPSAKE